MSFENLADEICKFNFKEMVHHLCKYAKFDVTCLNKLKVQYHSSTNKLFSHKPLCCRHQLLTTQLHNGAEISIFPNYLLTWIRDHSSITSANTGGVRKW